MHINKIDDHFSLSFGSKELSNIIAEMKKSKTKLKESVLKDKCDVIISILSEARSEYPMGDRILYIDREALDEMVSLVKETTHVSENIGYWVEFKHMIINEYEKTTKHDMPSFRSILESVKKEYKYRIKTVVSLDEDQEARLEKVLQKYELVDIEPVKKTMVQQNPMDFYDVNNTEVFIYDIVTYLPISAYVLQQELRTYLGLSEKYIVVRGENDPLEIESEKIRLQQEIESEANDKGYDIASLLSVDSEYPEDSEPGSDFYGNEYNSHFLTHLAQLAATRKSMEIDPPNPLFSWLNMPKNEDVAEDFNKDAEGSRDADGKEAPKPIHRFSDLARKNNPYNQNEKISDSGIVDDEVQTVVKHFKDKKGKTVKIEKDNDSLRK